jgi:hypothetical protein
MTNSRHAVEFAGRTLDRSRHICAFFNSADEERRVLRSFNKDGIDRGEKEVHLVEVALRAEYLKGLVIMGGLLQENPFYVPPEQFLDEMRERRSVRMTEAH